MAPSFDCTVTYVYLRNATPTNAVSYIDFKTTHIYNYYRLHNYNRKPTPKPEPKKERIARIAKERMYASWKTQDEILPNIYKIKQVCRPEHRVNFMGRRN